MEVIVGTYEELLLGYSLVKENDNYKLQQTFTNHTHTGCVKCLACQKNLLVSGSTDETIRIFDLKKRRELGTLHQHSGTISSLEFFEKSHMFSTSEDCTLCVWKVSGWEPVRTFKGHKGAVNSVSVHPTGKLALTVSHDRALRLWNLVDGRPAFTSNIKHVADIVVWSPDGDFYIVCWDNTINVYSVQEGSVCSSITAARRINSVVFLKVDIIAYAGEGGDIFFHNILEGKQLCQLSTETSRIRGLAVCASHENPNNQDECWLSAASSEGHIKVYRISASESKIDYELLASHNTTFRLTCITTTKPCSEIVSKSTPLPERKRKAGISLDEVQPRKVKKTVKETETAKSLTAEVEVESSKKKQVKVKVGKKAKKMKPAKSPQLPSVEESESEKTAGPQEKKKKVKFGEVRVQEIDAREEVMFASKLKLGKKQKMRRHGKGKAERLEFSKQKRLQKKLKKKQKGRRM